MPCPLCSLWAAGWWESVHSPFSQDREVGRGCLCTPGRPSWLCPGLLCWECVPSVCNYLTESQTAEQGPWRALGPDPFPEEKKQMQTTQQLHNNCFTFRTTELVSSHSWETADTYRQPKTGHFHRLLICVSLFGVVDQLGKTKQENTCNQTYYVCRREQLKSEYVTHETAFIQK